jgi:hypothetical protein
MAADGGVPLTPLAIVAGDRADDAGLRRTLCRARTCRVRRVRPAGFDRRGARLSVVSLRLDEVADEFAPGREPEIAAAEHWLVATRGGRVERVRFLVYVENISLSHVADEVRVERGAVHYAIGGYGAPGGGPDAVVDWAIALDPIGLAAAGRAAPGTLPPPGLPLLCVGHRSGPCPRACPAAGDGAAPPGPGAR